MPNDQIYHQLGRPDIITKIKDSQYKCNQKVVNYKLNRQMVIKAFSMCKDLLIYKYYKNLQAGNQKLNRIERITGVNN